MDPAAPFLFIRWTDPVFVGAAVLTVGLLVFAIWRARQAPPPQAEPEPKETSKNPLTPGKARTLAELRDDEEVENASLLSRFVLNAKGETVGETLSIDDEHVVLKKDGRFFVVSPEHVLAKDGMLIADANIDWDEAGRAGDAWRETSEDRIEYDAEGMPVLDKK